MSQLHGDIKAVERAVNHTHLGDMAQSFRDIGPQNQAYLAEIIASCWRCRLQHTYPDRRFGVDVSSDPEGADQEITFCQSD